MNTQKISHHCIFNVPNLLSLLRLCMIPVIVYLYVKKQNYPAATAMLILSGLTDIADGIIARKCNMVTDFGKAFDPVADKLTQIAVLFCLMTRFQAMRLPLLLLVIKELFTGTMSLIVIRKTGDVLPAVWHGKMTTASIYTMMILHLLWFGIPPAVSHCMILLCTCMILLSGVLYAKQNFSALKKRRG